MKTKKQTGKKVLSVFLAVLMVMTAWVFVAPTEAEAALAYGMSTVGDNFSKSTMNITNWGTISITYPSKMYIDKTESLNDAQYYLTITASNTTASLYLYPVCWGGQEFGASYNTAVGLKGQTSFVDAFNGYGISKWGPNSTSSGTEYGSGWFDNITYDSQGCTIFRCDNPSSNLSGGSDKYYFHGTPSGTGTFSFKWSNYNTNTANPIVGSSGGENKNKVWLSGVSTSGTRIDMTIVVYDKSALNSEINTSAAITNGDNRYTTSSWNTFQSALTNARSTLTKREVTQNDIDSARTTLYNARNDLKYNNYTITWIKKDGTTAGTVTKSWNSAVDCAALSAQYPNTIAPIANNDGEHQTYIWDTSNYVSNLKADIVIYETPSGKVAHTYDGYTQGETNHSRTCSVCGYVQTQAHIKDEGTVDKEETCTEDGIKTYDCSICGKTDIVTETINNITGHDFSGDAIENVTGENGNHWKKCSRCDAYGWAGVENACEKHNWDKNSDGQVNASDADTKASTCKEAGYEKYTCKVCNATWTKTLDLAAHKTIATAAKDVTNVCGGDGNLAFWKCSVCNRVWKDAALTDELTDTTDADNDGIPDALETKGPEHSFTGAYVSASGGKDGTHHRQCARFTQCKTYGPEEKHTWGDPAVTDATCLKTGKKVYTCTSGCGQTYEEVIEKAAHQMTKTEAVAPECGKAGNNEYYSCSTCSKYYKDEAGTTVTTVEAETLPALTHKWSTHHDYDTLNTAATCQAAAIYNNHCDYCKAQIIGTEHTYGNPIAHVYNGTKKSNGDGTHSYACTNDCNCGTYGVGSTKDETENCVYSNYSKIDATKHKVSCACGDYKEEGHSYGSWIADTTGVGTEKGTMTRTCPLCGQTETTECSYTEIGRVNATCDDPGSVTYKCTDEDCGHTYTETLPALGHEWVENNETYLKSAATCEANAVYYKYCTKCQKSSQTYTGETWTKKNSKLTHDWNEWVQSVDENGVAIHTRTCKHASSASCTEKGTCSGGTANCKDKAVCTVCKEAYGSVDSTNHKTVVTKAKVPATCQTEGTEAYRYCEACDTALETPVTIKKKAHTYSSWTKVDGKDEHTRYCTTCVDDAANNLVVDRQTADCNGGTAYCNKLAKCADCKAEYGELDPANHSTTANHLVNKKDATCQAPGYTGDSLYDCCNALKQSGKATPKLDHSFTIEVTRTPATCIAEGSVTYKCSTCVETEDVKAETKTDELPINAKNHASTVTKIVGGVEATCKDNGFTGNKYYTCCYDENKTEEENKKALAEAGTVIQANGDNHTALENVAAVPATCQKAGNKAYRYCSTCNTYLINGERVTYDQTREAKIAHKFTTYVTNGNGTHTATCDTCDETIAAKATDTKDCSGGTANCTDLAKCSVCGGSYGKLDATTHKTVKNFAKVDSTCQTEGYEAYQYCEACNKNITEKKIISKKAHKFGEWTPVDGKDEHTRSCTACDPTVGTVATETEACKGGTATCKNKAVCSVCAQEYGALNPNNHISDKVVTEERVEATCQKDGWTGREYYACCYVEGEDNTAALKNSGTTLPKVAHKYVEVEGTRVPATCLTTGTVTYKCSTCVDTEELDIATKTETLSIDKRNHASEEILTLNAVEATCSTEGYSGDKYHACCYDINKTTSLIQKGYKLSATGIHNYGTAIPEYLVEYTKDADGNIIGITAKTDNLTYEQKIAYRDSNNKWKHVQICADCYDIKESTCYTYNHTSTCTTTDICEECGGICSLVNLKKHNGELVLIPEVPSTCSNPGTIAHYKCNACNKLFFDKAGQTLVEKTEDLKAEVTIEHEIKEGSIATPAENGTHKYECAHCDVPIVEDCSGGTADCHNKAKCSICGQEYGEIDATKHMSNELVIVGKKAATCSDGGYTGDSYYKCCYVEGADDNSKALKAKGETTPNDPSLHVMKLRDNGDGTHTEYCEGCNKYELPAAAHNWVAGNVPETASCTEGYDLSYTCDCGATKTEKVEAKGHDYAETVSEMPATCTTAGEKSIAKVCKVCGDSTTATEIIKALGHDKRTIKGIPATCSTNGSTDYIYCNRCDTVLQDTTVIPATGCEDKNNDGFCDSCGTYLRTNEDGTNCNCICHKKNVFMKLLYKFLNFFWKLFKIEKTCDCGTVTHW